MLAIIIRCVFQEGDKLYPQAYLDECLYELYDRIDVSEGIDINKTNKSTECMLCHYWYFEDLSYKFQPYLCNGCHAVSMMAYELKNIEILNTKGVDYRCILWGISRDEAVNRLNNSVLEDKGVL